MSNQKSKIKKLGKRRENDDEPCLGLRTTQNKRKDTENNRYQKQEVNDVKME